MSTSRNSVHLKHCSFTIHWKYAFLNVRLPTNVSRDLPDPFVSAEMAHSYLMKIWDNDLISLQEEFIVLYFDQAQHLLCHRKLSRGNSYSTDHCIRLLCAIGLRCQASYVIVAHNHPSGNPLPSTADIKVTVGLYKALAFIGIELLDHLIICKTDFASIDLPILRSANTNYTPNAAPFDSYTTRCYEPI